MVIGLRNINITVLNSEMNMQLTDFKKLFAQTRTTLTLQR